MSALLDAAERGDLLQVKVEVEKRGGDPQERDSDGWTPLHWAARYVDQAVGCLLAIAVHSHCMLI